MQTLEHIDFEAEDERLLHSVLRRSGRLEQEVSRWATALMAKLPGGLPLTDTELSLLRLYLMEQRRRNLELDLDRPQAGFASVLTSIFPFLETANHYEADRLAHHLTACRIEDDIAGAADRISRQHDLSEMSEAVVDWRVAVRYLAQQLYAIVALPNSGRRLDPDLTRSQEFAIISRELSKEIVARRSQLEPSLVPVLN